MPAVQEKPTDFIVDDEPKEKPVKKSEEDEATESEKKAVKAWIARIKDAERHWEPDFIRMRKNMEFVAGIQWDAQETIESKRYVANMTIRMVNQKVATLYARNPSVVATRRKRLDFQLWDGKMETIMQAVGTAMSAQQQIGFVPPEAMALMNDYMRGKQLQELVDKICKTMEVVYQYEQDAQEPNFKTQAKAFVRRVSVCGVAYIKVLFCRDYEEELTHSETNLSVIERAQRAQLILQKLAEGKIQDSDAQLEVLKSLVQSMGVEPLDSEAVRLKEHLVFDFPPATSVIPDKNCRNLKGFVGARYVAEKFFYPLDFVNAKYELDIKPGGEIKQYKDGKPDETSTQIDGADQCSNKPTICLYQVYDLDTKSTFILCDGYKTYVQKPEPLTPTTSGFWQIFPLTFNDIETEPGCRSTIYPPSDVELIKHPQKEWNRSREGLRNQRKANAPKYMCPKGTLTENDKEAISNANDNEVIELEGLPPGADPSKVFVPLQHAPIDPQVYDTRPLAEDAMLTTGQQESNMGPAQPNVTATVGTIAEQSRMTVSSSNVDDLDDCLSCVARCGGEMLLKEMSLETVQRIAGPGAVWPQQNQDDFVNQVQLEVVAASSGRPNKAIEVANFERVAPLLIQAGANPQAIIREAIKRLDDRLDPTEFFPIPLPPAPALGGPVQGAEGQPTNGEGQPGPGRTPPNPSQEPEIPLVGA